MKGILLVLTHGNEQTMQDQNHNSDANFVGEKTAAQSVPDEKRSSKLLQDPLSQKSRHLLEQRARSVVRAKIQLTGQTC